MSMSPDALWNMTIQELAGAMVARTSQADLRYSTAYSAVLSARVSLEVAQRQEDTTAGLVQATHDLVRQTRNLAWATIAVAALTGVSALVVAFSG